MRGKSLIFMPLIIIVFTSLVTVNVGYAQVPPKVYVDPAAPVANPTEYLDVSIKVAGTPAIQGFEFKLRWDRRILDLPAVVTEGDFVKSAGATDFRVVTNLVESYMLVSCHLKSTVPSPPSGAGTLAVFKFYVLVSGVTNLTLFEVKLYDYTTGGLVPDVTVEGGHFSTTKPYVDFSWTPVSPEVDEIATFNASACKDPDGGSITSYKWDFGDGTTPTTTADPIITHSFSDYSYGGYVVNLTATDDEGETWSKTKTLRMWHEIIASDIWVTDWDLMGVYTEVTWTQAEMPYGELVVLATVVNLGSYAETFDVTLYADLDTTVIGDEYVFAWFGTDPYATITLGSHKGSGWNLFFTADMFLIWEEGDYTLTLVASTMPGETSTENNVLTAPTKLHVTVTPPSDMNLDKVTDIYDIVLAAEAFGSYPGHPRWNNLADQNNDNLVDIFDIVSVAMNFGTTW